MPNNIDNRIVQMEFDNKQFERGVQESLKSLEALKKGLELDKATASLSNLEKVTSQFDISGIARGIENIAGHFSYLGRHVDRIVDNITAKVSGMLKSISVDQIGAGMSKYETQTKSVQTIMNATGKEIGEVESVLNDLMKYTDETSYDFATMSESIGKFTSVGVDLARAEKAMEGIANEAAMSGAGKAEANRAMYNFAQALSAGYVKLIDWKSIENANMATKTFKEELIKTALETGALNKVTETSGKIMKGTGKSAKSVTVDFKTFNETLSEGWLTSDVLIKTLERYADKTQGIGKQAYEAAQKALTYTDALDAIKDAVSSGWMQSFKYLFGNLEEAMDLWTGFCNAIIEFTTIFSEARNELLKGWHELGGYNAMLEAASNIWNGFMGIVKGVGEALGNVFPPLTAEKLVAATEKVRLASEKFREIFGVSTQDIESKITTVTDHAEELVHVLKKGDKNDFVAFLQQNLVKAGITLDKFGADGIYGPETEKAVKDLQKQLGVKQTGIWDEQTRSAAIAAGVFQEVSETIETTTVEIYKARPELDRIKEIISGLASIVDILFKGLKLGFDIVVHFISLFAPLGKALLNVGGLLGRIVTNWHDNIVESGLFGKALETVKKFLEPFGKFIQMIADKINGFLTENSWVSNFEQLFFVLGQEFKKIPAIAKNWDKISKVGNKLKTMFASLGDKLKSAYEIVKNFLSENFTKAIKYITETVPKVISGIGGFVKHIYESIAASDKLKKIWSSIKSFFTSVGRVLKDVFGSIKEWFSNKFSFNVDASFGEKLISAFNSFKEGISNAFSTIKEKFKEFRKNHPVIDSFVEKIQKAKDKILEFVGVVKEAFANFFGKNTNEDDSVGSNIVFTDLSPFESLKKRLESLKPILDWFINFKDKFLEAIGQIFGKNGDSSVKPDRTSVLDVVKTKISDFISFLRGIDWTKLIGPALGALGAYSLFSGLKLAKQISGGFQDIAKGYYLKKGGKIDTAGDTALKVAGAVGILALSVGLLSIIDVEKAKKGLEVFAEALGAVVGAMVIVGNFGKEGAHLGTQVLMLAGSVALLSFGLWMITSVVKNTDAKTLGISVGIIAAMIAALAFIEIKLAKAGSGVSISSGFSLSNVLQMCAGLVLVVLAFGKMAKIVNKYKGTETLLPAFGIIEAMLITLGGIEIALAALSKNSLSGGFKISGILGMAAGLWVIVQAFSKVAKIVHDNGSEEAWSAFGIIELLLVTVGGIAVLMAAFSKGLLSAIGTAATFVAMGWSMSEIIKAFGNAISQISGTDPKLLETFFIGIETAMGVLAAIVAVFGHMPVQVLLGSLGLVVVMGALAAGVEILAAVGYDVLTAFGNALWIIGSKLGDFQRMTAEVDFEKIASIKNLIVDTIVPMITSISDLSTDVALTQARNLTQIGAQLALYSSEIENVSAAKSGFAKMLVTDAKLISDTLSTITVSDQYENGVLSRLGAQLTLYSGEISTIDSTKSESAKTLASDAKIVSDTLSGITVVDGIGTILTNLGAALNLYYTQISGIKGEEVTTVDSTMVSNAFSALSGAIPKESIDKIKSFASGGDNDMTQMVLGITALGGALKSYTDNISGIDFDAVTSANNILSKVSEVNESLKSVSIGELLGIFVGNETSITDFATDIVELGTALGNYATNIGGVDSDQVEAANTIIDKVKSIEDSFDKVTWDDLFGFLKGKREDMTSFGGDMVELGTAIGKFAESTKDVNKDKIESATGVIDVVSTLNEKLPTTGQIWTFIAGKKDLGLFASNMSTLGDGVAGYANKVADANFTNINESLTSVEKLAGVFTSIGKTGGAIKFLTGDKDISALTTNLDKVADDLLTFQSKTSEVDTAKLESAFRTIEKITTLQNSVDWKATNTGGLKSLGSSIKDMFANLAKIDSKSITAVEELGKSIILRIATGMSEASDGDNSPKKQMLIVLAGIHKSGNDQVGAGSVFEKLGKTMDNSVANGVKSQAYYPSSVFGRMIAQARDTGYSYQSNFYNVGFYLVKGLTNGISNYSDLPSSAFRAVVTNAYVAGMRAARMHSPSKVTAWMGQMLDMGLVVGLQDYSGRVESASSEVIDGAINTATMALRDLSAAIENDIDANPRITPVLDLSNVEAEAGGISGLFGSQTIGVKSATIAGRIASTRSENAAAAVQTSDTGLRESIDVLNSRLDQLDASISNMKVVMDNGALVGQVAPGVDKYMGRKQAARRRGS